MVHLALNSSYSLPQYQFCVGETIPCPPDFIYLCVKGVILVSTAHATGDEGMLGLVTSGLLFGLPLTEAAPYKATALTAVCLYRLNFAELRQCPRVALQVLPHLVESIKRNEEFLIVANRRSVQERFDAFLTLLCRRVGRQTEGGILLDVRLTHQQIANAISATRVSVTRLMTRYREMGIVLDNNQKWLVRKPEKLHPGSSQISVKTLASAKAGTA